MGPAAASADFRGKEPSKLSFQDLPLLIAAFFVSVYVVRSPNVRYQ